MKIILTLLMFVTSITAFSQTSTSESDTTSVGDEMIRFERQYSNGRTIAMAGTIFVIAGASTLATPVIIAGGVIMFIGDFIAADSHKHMRIAGLLMNKNRIGTKLNKL
jgi:ABC-type phosphate transport system permease subunit